MGYGRVFLCYGRTTFGVRPRATCSQYRLPCCYTGGLINAGAYPCCWLFNTLYRTAPRELSVWCKLSCVGPVYQRAHELRDTGMPRLRRVAGLCSSNLSDAANTLRRHGRKILCRSPASAAVTCQQLRQGPQGKGRFTRGWKPQVSALLCATAQAKPLNLKAKNIVYQKIIS